MNSLNSLVIYYPLMHFRRIKWVHGFSVQPNFKKRKINSRDFDFSRLRRAKNFFLNSSFKFLKNFPGLCPAPRPEVSAFFEKQVFLILKIFSFSLFKILSFFFFKIRCWGGGPKFVAGAGARIFQPFSF